MNATAPRQTEAELWEAYRTARLRQFEIEAQLRAAKVEAECRLAAWRAVFEADGVVP